MTNCLICGKECEIVLCCDCKENANLKRLCTDIISYDVENGSNEIWNNIIGNLEEAKNFKHIAFALADELPTPQKEYYKIMSLVGDRYSIAKSGRNWLYEIAKACLSSIGLSDMQRDTVIGLLLEAKYQNYEYDEAEKLAKIISGRDRLPPCAVLALGDYYIKTRRYFLADEVLSSSYVYLKDEKALNQVNSLLDDLNKRLNKEKPEFMPNPKTDKDIVKSKYIDFLNSIGVEAQMPVTKKSKIPSPIPKENYPDPIETRNSGFKSFVAFDVETTGFSPAIDSITEIGAIRVVDGKITEEKSFLFSELIHPYDKKISEQVSAKTGITNDMVRNAREMWEVFPAFMNFVGDDILVGFNCISFDSKFLARAGRYSHMEIKNKFFDVMRYAMKFKAKLNIDGRKTSLENLCDKLEITNTQAHRALSDSVATAKAYLKLLELDGETPPDDFDDLLSDIDNW